MCGFTHYENENKRMKVVDVNIYKILILMAYFNFAAFDFKINASLKK